MLDHAAREGAPRHCLRKERCSRLTVLRSMQDGHPRGTRAMQCLDVLRYIEAPLLRIAITRCVLGFIEHDEIILIKSIYNVRPPYLTVRRLRPPVPAAAQRSIKAPLLLSDTLTP